MSFGLTAAMDALLASGLANVAPITMDAQVAETGDCPRITIERLRTARAPTPRITAVASRTTDQRLEWVDAHTLRVSLWGATGEACERMRQALITAIRGGLGGCNIDIGSAEWVPVDWAQRGALLRVEVIVYVALPRAVLPTSHADPYVDPATSVTSHGYTTATIATVQMVDDPATASNNNILETGDT